MRIKKSVSIIKIFNLVIVFISIQSFTYYSQQPVYELLLKNKLFFEPLWPVYWITKNNFEIAIYSILMCFFISSIVNILFWKRFLWIRILNFISFFQYLSLISSYGKVDHYLHLALIGSFLFIFIPTSKEYSLKDKKSFLTIMVGFQSFILLTYFVSGFFKFHGIISQITKNEVSALHPEALGQLIALTMNGSVNEKYFLADYIINNPSPIHSVILITGYFIEIFAIVVIFKPNLLAIWGILLILLHIVILMTVGPDFSIQILIIGLFILYSPFNTNNYVNKLYN